MVYTELVGAITGAASDLNTRDTYKPVPVPLTYVSPFFSNLSKTISVLETGVPSACWDALAHKDSLIHTLL